MHITKIRSQDMRLPLLDEADLEFDESVNLFVGPNASGKSSILRAIKALHSWVLSLDRPPLSAYQIGRDHDGELNYYDDENYGTPGGGLNFSMWPSDDWPRDDSGAARWNEVPFLYIPATRVNLPVQRIFEPYIFDKAVEEQEYVEAKDILKRLFDTESGIFDGRYVELAIDGLRRGLTGDRAKQDQLRESLQLAYSCVQSICSEVISDAFPHTFVDQYEIPDARRIVHHGMGIGTNESTWDSRQPLYAGALSSGTQSTLLWVYALALKVLEHYGSGFLWEGKLAILLIDEIENHLHPTWQRRVIPALLEHFPGLQIFATTHSPFVVAGLKAGQVHLLKRDENGVVTATTNTEDVIGWTADEILRNMMGVDEPTDQLTVDRASRLRQLREKESLTSEEESELNELRRQVNEDLLSKGGPLEAQRESYGELMEQFLRSRQSELTQDGD